MMRRRLFFIFLIITTILFGGCSQRTVVFSPSLQEQPHQVIYSPPRMRADFQKSIEILLRGVDRNLNVLRDKNGAIVSDSDMHRNKLFLECKHGVWGIPGGKFYFIPLAGDRLYLRHETEKAKKAAKEAIQAGFRAKGQFLKVQFKTHEVLIENKKILLPEIPVLLVKYKPTNSGDSGLQGCDSYQEIAVGKKVIYIQAVLGRLNDAPINVWNDPDCTGFIRCQIRNHGIPGWKDPRREINLFQYFYPVRYTFGTGTDWMREALRTPGQVNYKVKINGFSQEEAPSAVQTPKFKGTDYKLRPRSQSADQK